MIERYSNMTGATARALFLYNNIVSALFKHYYNSKISDKWHSNGFQNNLRFTFEHDLLVKQLNDYNFRRCIDTPGVL